MTLFDRIVAGEVYTWDGADPYFHQRLFAIEVCGVKVSCEDIPQAVNLARTLTSIAKVGKWDEINVYISPYRGSYIHLTDIYPARFDCAEEDIRLSLRILANASQELLRAS